MKICKSSKLIKSDTLSFFLILIFLYFYIFFLIMFFNSYIFWWSIFLFIRVFFFYLLKSFRSYLTLINYFVIQEVLGLLFILLYFYNLQFLFLILKVGVSPFHFWVLLVGFFLEGLNFFWFITFQKLPFIPVIYFFFLNSLFFLFLGFLFCYIQIFLFKYFKLFLIVSSLERFNWILLNIFFRGLNFFFIFFYYFVSIVLILTWIRSFNISFLGWELILLFMNFPLRISFFLKLFRISFFSVYFIFFSFFVFILMFLSILVLRYIFFLLGIKTFFDFKKEFFVFFFCVYRFQILFLIFYISKNNYIILIR